MLVYKTHTLHFLFWIVYRTCLCPDAANYTFHFRCFSSLLCPLLAGYHVGKYIPSCYDILYDLSTSARPMLMMCVTNSILCFVICHHSDSIGLCTVLLCASGPSVVFKILRAHSWYILLSWCFSCASLMASLTQIGSDAFIKNVGMCLHILTSIFCTCMFRQRLYLCHECAQEYMYISRLQFECYSQRTLPFISSEIMSTPYPKRVRIKTTGPEKNGGV